MPNMFSIFREEWKKYLIEKAVSFVFFSAKMEIMEDIIDQPEYHASLVNSSAIATREQFLDLISLLAASNWIIY